MKLYEISQQFNELLSREDIDEETLADTFEGLEFQLKEKAKNIGGFILNLEVQAKAIKEAEQNMNKRRKVLENKAASLKKYLHNNMVIANKDEFKYPEYDIKIKKNPPKVVVDNEDVIPEKFKKVITTINIDKNALKDKLKVEDVLGAHLEQTTRLHIK